MLRIATIGTNFITDRFLEAAGCCEGIAYTVTYSRNEETAKAFALKHGAKRYETDIQKLAEAEDVDAVYIASPNSLHCEQALLMMSHGKHVLCEKAAASNSRELAQMLQSAKEHQVVFLEAMRPIFDPGLAAIEANLHRLGTIRRVSFQFAKYSSRYDHFRQGVIENAFNPAFSNGALMDIGVYCVHTLVSLFGAPKSVLAQAVMLPGGIDGAGTILAGYPGMQAEILYSKITDNHLPSQIQGEEGTMVIRNIQEPVQLTIYDRNGKTEERMIEKEKNSMIYEIREWCRMIDQRLSGERYHQISSFAMEIMDEARRQINLVFPADGNPSQDREAPKTQENHP